MVQLWNRLTNKKSWAVLSLALLALIATSVMGESNKRLPSTIEPLLTKYCVSCHGEEKQKGDIRFDRLDPDIVHGKDAEIWQLALDQLNLGDMPPKRAKKKPTNNERRQLVNWLTESLKEAAQLKRKNIRGVMRRLTKEQYTRSLQDLLKLEVDFGRHLPPEGLSADGFKNNGETLTTSLLQTEYYLNTAQRALNKTIISDNPPTNYRYNFKFGKGINKDPKKKQKRKPGAKEVPISTKDHIVVTSENRHMGTTESNYEVNDNGQRSYPDLRGARNKRFKVLKEGILLQPAIPTVEKGGDIWLAPMPSLKIHLRDFPMEGDYVYRVKVARANTEDKEYPYLRFCVGEWLDHGEDFQTLERSVKVTGTLDSLQTIEFRGRLENHPIPIYDPNNKDIATMIVLGIWNDALALKKSVGDPALIVDSIEIEFGHLGAWPPEREKHIFIDSDNKNNELVYSREIIQSFLNRAFRRPASQSEVDSYYELWKSFRPDCLNFKQSIRDTLASVLCSPKFLFLVESPVEDTKPDTQTKPNIITEHELASRLAYFLWNTMPDDQLLQLAKQNQLRYRLPSEINRLIKDPRSRNFVADFCEQWLEMEKMTHTKVDVNKFPRFNRFVRDDMHRETRLFFEEIFYKNMSILTFVDADFTMLNQNLAQFYGMDNIRGGHFRKVALAEDSKRGGLISQGLFLTGNSNGKEPHPIKRGAWLISRLLDDPPPPPPPNVPQLDEDDPNFTKLPIKKQLEIHRDNPSCFDCHAKVDPWGLLLENYNAVGLWKHTEGAAEATLPTGKTLDGVDALKAYILKEKKDQFARSLVQHLLRYALGRSLSFTDREEIDKIIEQVKKDDYRLQGLLRSLITSPLFSKR